MVLDWFVTNWAWTLFLLAFAAGAVLMRKIPNVQVMGHILFKINSKKGIKLMDSLGRGHARFWKDLGDFALIVLFGGIGTAFVTNHRGKKARRLILSILTFLSIFVYLGPNVVSFFPFQVIFSEGYVAFFAALAGAFVVFNLSNKLSKRVATILSFFLAAAFFASPYLLSYFYGGEILYLFIGIAVGVLGLPAIVIINLLVQANNIAVGASDQPGVNIGYPDIENGAPVLKYAGTDISIPFFPDILIAFIVLLVLHEGFHGLLSRAQDIAVENTGLLFASIIPLGAFVEPKEEQFKNEENHKRLRVYAVGSFANIFVVALGVFLLTNFLVASDLIYRDGAIVSAVVQNTSASESIAPGDIVYSIDGKQIQGWPDVSRAMANTSPGENISIVTSKGVLEVILGKHPNNPELGFLGISPKNHVSEQILKQITLEAWSSNIDSEFDATLLSILKWIYFLNLMLGLINLLPLKPLDGGYVYDGFFTWVEKGLPFGKSINLAKLVSQGFIVLILTVFIVNFLPYFL